MTVASPPSPPSPPSRRYARGDDHPTLTVIIPAFNEADTIAEVFRELRESLLDFPGLIDRVEVVVVSDGSTDDTYVVSERALNEFDLNGHVIQLARNVGSHTAILCGIRYADTDYVAVMSADGQDPPATVLALFEHIQSGYDVVWGNRTSRQHDPFLRRLLATSYYRLFRFVTRLDFPPGGLDLFVVTRRVATVINNNYPRGASIFLYLFNLPLHSGSVPYERQERSQGRSKWTLKKRIALGINMFTGLSPAPIRLTSVVGGLLGIVGMLYGVATIVQNLLIQSPVPGWSSLMVVVSMMSGLILILLGIIGEYLWRILDNVNPQPRYLEVDISHTTNLDGDSLSPT